MESKNTNKRSILNFKDNYSIDLKKLVLFNENGDVVDAYKVVINK